MRLHSQVTASWVEIDETCVLGAGGEGRVYGVLDFPGLAAKLYDDGGRAERDEKLRAMLANPPAGPGAGGHTAIAWPQDLLAETPGGALAGYLMPRVRNGRVIDDFYNPQARLEQCPLFHYEYLLVVARNLAAAVRSLHQRGIVLGDVKQSNILVTPTALVTLVDTDSFQVTGTETGKTYRCPVGTPEYTPPELQGLMAPGLLKPEHDLFGLAVLIFQLLMEGAHPFAGVYMGGDDPPPLGDRIKMGWFPYDSPPEADAAPSATFRRQQELVWRLPPPFVPARKALPFSVLPVEIRYLFMRCFVEGRDDPERRPSAHEWQQALDHARSALVKCSANSQHRYGSHLPMCPWCDRMRTVLRGNDPYPAASEIERLKAPARRHGTPGAAAMPSFPLSSNGTPLHGGFQTNVPASPLFHSNSPAAYTAPRKMQSGWASYAVAALGIPVVLGLLSSHEVRDERRTFSRYSHDPRTYQSWHPSVERGESWAPIELQRASPAPLQVSAVSRPSPVRACLTPDGRHAAITKTSTVASIVDCRTGQNLHLLMPSGGRAAIDCVAVSDSGAQLAAADRLSVVVWNRNNRIDRKVLINPGTVRALAYSPDGKVLAVCCSQSDALVTLVDPEVGETPRKLTGNYGEMPAAIQFSPDGTRIYAVTVGSAANGSALYCWDVASGALHWRHNIPNWQTHIAISPDGKTLALGGARLDLITAIDGQAQPYNQQGSPLMSGVDPICFSQRGSQLAVNAGYAVSICRFGNGVDVTLPITDVVSAAFSSDGTRLTTLSQLAGVEEWDLNNQRRIRRLAIPMGDR